METVTSMLELIDAIFAHLSREENAITALVCKQWLEISRDHIWHEVYRPTELFNLLSPLQPEEDNAYVRSSQLRSLPLLVDSAAIQISGVPSHT